MKSSVSMGYSPNNCQFLQIVQCEYDRPPQTREPGKKRAMTSLVFILVSPLGCPKNVLPAPTCRNGAWKTFRYIERRPDDEHPDFILADCLPGGYRVDLVCLRADSL